MDEAVFGNGWFGSEDGPNSVREEFSDQQGRDEIGVSVASSPIPSTDFNLKPSDKSDSFFTAALRILYTLTPAILILDSNRRIVFANRQAEELLEQGDVISLDRKGKIFCVDHVAQNFLLQYLGDGKRNSDSLFGDQESSFLIPKADGWPMVAMVGCDQLDAMTYCGDEFNADRHVTLMIRDPDGYHPDQSEKLMAHFGLSGAESTVVGQLARGHSTTDIAEQRGVSVVTIRNQLKSAQSKLGVTRQSELVSLVLRYIS